MTVNWIARSSPNVSYAHFRTDLISFTAAMPLLAIKTCYAKSEQFGIRQLARGEQKYRCDYSVSIMLGDEILDLAWSSCIQVIAPNEVGREVVFR